MNEKIIDNTNNGCVANAIAGLKLISAKLPELICGIFNVNEPLDFDMTLTMGNEGTIEGAHTQPNLTSSHFNVQINNYFTEATDLSLAVTLIHEAIHCQLMNWFRLAANDPARQHELAVNYGYQFPQYVVDFNNGLGAIVNGPLAAQHQDIATRYRDMIGNALFQFASSKGINVNLSYCKDLALSGCPDSRYFTSLSVLDQNDLLDIINAEKDPSGTSVNVNNISSKGHPCAQ